MEVQSTTVRNYVERAGLFYIFSASGVDVYRKSDWTRVAWAALSGVVCGAVNDAGIWLGTYATGVWFLPLNISSASSYRLTQALTSTSTTPIQSDAVIGLAANGTTVMIVTTAGIDLVKQGTVYGCAAVGLLGPCAMTATQIAYAAPAGVVIRNTPTADWDIDDDERIVRGVWEPFTGANGSAPDSTYWSKDNEASGTIEIQEDALRVRTDAAAEVHVTAITNWLIDGDFDVSAKISNISDVSTSATCVACLMTCKPDGSSVSRAAAIMTESSAFWQGILWPGGTGEVVTVARTAMAGFVRVTRSGNVLTNYYRLSETESWEQLNQATDSALAGVALNVKFTAYSASGGPAFGADWDNLHVDAAAIISGPPQRLPSDTVQAIAFAGDVFVATDAGVSIINSDYTPTPNDALAHYRMEVSGSTLLDPIGQNHGSIAGAPTVVAGAVGNALSFDGSDDNATLPEAMKVAYPLTICCRVWSNPTFGGSRHLICSDNSLAINVAVNSDDVPVFRSITVDDGYSAHVASGGAIQDGELLIWSYDGAYLKCYRGTPESGMVECVSVAKTGAIAYGAQTAGYMVGAYRGGSGTYTHYPAKIDEILFFQRILTAAERTAILMDCRDKLGAVALGTVVDAKAIHPASGAAIDSGLLAYGTSNGSAGGRFGLLDLADRTNHATDSGDTLSVWVDDDMAEAIHDSQLERYHLVAELSPGAGARSVRRDWALYAEITDALGGIQSGTVTLTVNGVSQTATTSAITDGYSVVYTPSSNSGYGERVNVQISGTDADENTVSKAWTFTTASAPDLTVTDASPPNVTCIRDIDLAAAESDETVGSVNVVWIDTITSPLIVTEAQAKEVGRVAIDGQTYHRHKVGVKVLATDAGALQTRDLRQGGIATITCDALGMSAQKCEILAAQRVIDGSAEDISFNLQAAYYEEV